MIDTAIDGRPVIRCAWPESTDSAHNGPVHTLEETAEYMRDHGMPNATKHTILDIERRALRKLRDNPKLQSIYKDLCHA